MLPNGGNRPPLSMADINGSSGFSGLGNNLNAYRGTLFYRPDNSTGYFSAGTINISDFYSTQRYSPVVSGSATYTSGSSITLPALFNTLTVTCYGGSGGGGGGSYLAGITISSGSGGNGGTGGSTTFASGQSYAVSAPGGGGGTGAGFSYVNYLDGGAIGSGSGTGTPGSNGSGADGGSPYIDNHGSGAADSQSHTYVTSGRTYTVYSAANGGAGGSGGKSSILVFNIATQGWAYVSQFYNASIPVSFGAGGSAGSGGNGYAGLAGGGGAGGKIILSWT